MTREECIKKINSSKTEKERAERKQYYHTILYGKPCEGMTRLVKVEDGK